MLVQCKSRSSLGLSALALYKAAEWSAFLWELGEHTKHLKQQRVPAVDKVVKREVLQLPLNDARTSKRFFNGGADFLWVRGIRKDSKLPVQHRFAPPIRLGSEHGEP